MKKLFSPLLMGLLLIVGISLPMIAQAQGQEVFVTLHKRGFNQAAVEEINNQGRELDPSDPIFQKTQGVNGVTFKVLDVTDNVRNELAKGKTVEALQEEMGKLDNNDELIKNNSTIFEGTTATGNNSEAGILSFPLSLKESGKSAYLIVETVSAKSQVASSSNTLLVLDGQYAGQTLHLYPKNILKKLPKTEPTEESTSEGVPISGGYYQRTTARVLPRTNDKIQPFVALIGFIIVSFVSVVVVSQRVKARNNIKGSK